VPGALRSLCHDADRCVCTGAGRDDYYCDGAMQSTMRQWKTQFGRAVWSDLVRNADLVLCFSWEDTRVAF
jgi:hypothetical protein